MSEFKEFTQHGTGVKTQTSGRLRLKSSMPKFSQQGAGIKAQTSGMTEVFGVEVQPARPWCQDSNLMVLSCPYSVLPQHSGRRCCSTGTRTVFP